MSRAWAPWVLPVAMVVAVVIAAISSVVAAFVLLLGLLVVCCAVLVVLRLRYLKAHPPDPELVHKPFWRL